MPGPYDAYALSQGASPSELGYDTSSWVEKSPDYNYIERKVAVDPNDPNQGLYQDQLKTMRPSNTGSTLAPANVPTLQDFTNEAQKLGLQELNATRGILRQDIGQVGDDLSRRLYGQNVGSRAGIGENVVGREISAQAQRLEPIAAQIAARTAQQSLTQQFNAAESEKDRSFQKLNTLFSLAQTGNLKGTPLEATIRAMGITDPQGFMTNDEAELRSYAMSKGLTVDEVLEQRRLLGRVFDKDVKENPQRYAGLAEDPQLAFEREQAIARANNPAPEEESGGKIICTLLYRNGLLKLSHIKADYKYLKYHCSQRVHENYLRWASVFVLMIRDKRWAMIAILPIVRAWSAYMQAVVKGTRRPLIGATIHHLGVAFGEVYRFYKEGFLCRA